MKKLRGKEAAFYMLYISYKKDPLKFLGAWEFSNKPVHVSEFTQTVYLGHTGDRRVNEIYHDNPGLLERERMVGATGARYYAYRVIFGATSSFIRDNSLRDFFLELRKRRLPSSVDN